MNVASRIERIIMGVLQQALRDSGLPGIRIVGTAPHTDLLRSWCERHGGTIAVSKEGLAAAASSKTELLLGGHTDEAAVYPFGDLYHTQLEELAGREVTAETKALDDALMKFFDERRPWPEASAEIAEPERTKVYESLERARWQRKHCGLIPKIGARTLGIDLYA